MPDDDVSLVGASAMSKVFLGGTSSYLVLPNIGENLIAFVGKHIGFLSLTTPPSIFWLVTSNIKPGSGYFSLTITHDWL
jgi:hypothetical protein